MVPASGFQPYPLAFRLMRTKHQRPAVLVVGGANLDYLVKGTSLPGPGETIAGAEFLQAAGGKGANQAVAIARLGARTSFIGCLGADANGDTLLRSLKSERVQTSDCIRTRPHPTGVALILVDKEGEKLIMTAPGANRHLRPMHLNDARPLFTRARVVVTQLEIPIATVQRVLQLARAAGARTILDPAPPAKLPRTCFNQIDVIRPNPSEAEALTGIRVTDRASALRAAQRLISRGVKAAIVGAPRGNLVVYVNETKKPEPIWVPWLPVKTVDATGAGDAFVAGLAVALAEHRSWREAAVFASAAAALATTKFGAQPSMPRRAEVLRLMKKNGYAREASAFAKAK
jgi:ribokinase